MKQDYVGRITGAYDLAELMSTIEMGLLYHLPQLKEYQTMVNSDLEQSKAAYDKDLTVQRMSPHESMVRRLNMFVKFGEELEEELKSIDHPVLKDIEKLRREK